ncbi:MAG: sugar phosphate nucleotidyltransferase [Actinobacteria bacterium]|nr:sugar phosphate nucleotidyltransferase [Actinomycetota bacterium]
MKVVLFCGGQGMRLRDYSDEVPKPMVPVGDRPLLWHLMKYYAHFGHNDFILCLGHRADAIKQFFLNYEEAISNDFVLSEGGTKKVLLASDIDDWTITFVDTGLHSAIGERLRRVRHHLEGEHMFLANYADGLTDLDLNAYIKEAESRGQTGAFLAVRPPQSYHVATVDAKDNVVNLGPIGSADLWLNGGYFVFRKEIFDYIEKGDDLVAQPFHRLIAEDQLYAHRFEGFWSPMDTFKEQQYLDGLYGAGPAPWVVWKNGDT